MRNICHKLVRKVWSRYYIKKNEFTFNKRVKYLFEPNNSNKLLIVFSGFTGDKPKYNYFSAFKHLSMNKLFILDNFGKKGSYYWYENGEDYPEKLVLSLIKQIKESTGATKVITAGTSKGGTAALYFGLEIGASEIYSGACQFNVGTYLSRKNFEDIFEGMMGQIQSKKDSINQLDMKLLKKIEEKKETKAKVYLFYSKKELTYERHIIDLRNTLKEKKIKFDEKVENFNKHSDVGMLFPIYLIDKINEEE